MPQDDQKPRVTIEDILRLKRTERPAPEFWNRFERDLREKQLAALLEKRPWWHGLTRVLARHVYLPAGAAAALAFGLIAFRQYAPSPVAQQAPAAGGSRMLAEEAPLPARPVAVSENTAVQSPEVSPVESGPAAGETVPAIVASTVPNNVAEMIPWSAPRVEESPSARSIAANLARLEQTEPGLLDALLSPRPVQVQSAPGRPAMELASVSVSPARRSSRLLAGYNEREFVPEPTAPDLVRERIARRLGDAELFDQIRRLDVKGNFVSLKL